MSYRGGKYPEGVDQSYREISGPQEIGCPLFRRVVSRALDSKETARFKCDGCGTENAVIIVVDLETERLFVRLGSKCTEINGSEGL